MPHIPFRPSRKRNWLTSEEITKAMGRADAARDQGNTATAVQILTDLRQEVVKSFGLGHHKLIPIDEALDQLTES